MVRSATLLLASVNLLILLAIAGCGGTSMMNSARQLQSLMVTPSAADAQNFPGAKVQFMATGTFSMAPMTVTSTPVLWSVGSPSFMSPTPMPMSMALSTGPSVDANGVAQCNGFTGIATIEATAPADPNMPISQMSAMMRTVSGMAHLTCP